MAKQANVAQVPFGNISIEGLEDNYGEYLVAVQQVADLFSFDRNQATRTLKRLLGFGSSFDRVRANRNEHSRKDENAVTLEQFERITLKLYKQGNPVAEELTESLVGTSLKREFKRAFDRKWDEEDNQAEMRRIQKRKLRRREWTDVIMEYQEARGYYRSVEGQREFARLTAYVNRKLFGVSNFRSNRTENMTLEQQEIISLFEGNLTHLALKHPHLSLEEIIDRTLKFFG